ncbi:hypothetical protein EST38_g13783 [Candolleomyces aberdarensis]|uniref:CxC2-like cysteine cluster KDZ transposase-associated domain-containing protein n=1 Tax=Candolleomyces aberdarensis TaxID=2316362 RepID=A0A4Q2D1D0_9AGAR|nr:hypothetical protein EST38_g13783 [Candolleomyces aberdarensis]
MPTAPLKRISTCNATAYVDPDSDEELEIDLNAFINETGEAFEVYHAVPIQHSTHSLPAEVTHPTLGPMPSSNQFGTGINVLAQSDGPDTHTAGRKQGASVMMNIFAPHLADLQEAILEARISTFHFTVTPCPNRDVKNQGRSFFIVDVNGFHILPVVFCCCLNAEQEHLQLMHSKLFPATITQPSTAFTFNLLKNWSMHTLTSKKSAHDYQDALCKLTNPVFPHEVPDRSQELLCVSRIWRHLSDVRHAGQAHGIDELLPLRRKGSIATRCPACPEVGVNISQEVIDAAHEDETCVPLLLRTIQSY